MILLLNCLKSRILAQTRTVYRQKNLNVFSNNCLNRYIHNAQIYDSEQIVQDLCGSDKDLEKKLRVLMLEVEVMRQDGRNAPQFLKAENWKYLLDANTRSQRMNYLTFLWKTEMSKANEKARKEERKRQFEIHGKTDPREYPDDLIYGIGEKALFLRIYPKSVNNMDNYRALQAMRFGQSLVLDCSYEDNMVWRETLNAAKQVTLIFGDNRIHKEPFNIHLCNVQHGGQFMNQLVKNIPTILEPSFPINIHEKSYLDTFPKKDLVYLTPHCNEELTEFNHNAVYIVGCIVDKVNNEPLSLAKAKRDGIKMAKLPLDRFIEWAPGSNKSLNMNHVVPILSDLKMTGNWEYALRRHIPRRKLMETKIMAMEKRMKNNSLKDLIDMRSKVKFGNKSYDQSYKKQHPFKNEFKKHSLYDNNDKY